jgi:hypothetical protein
MTDLFKFTETKYNLRSVKIESRNIRTVKYGSETLPHIGAKLWNSLPNEYKSSTTITEFKNKIKNWIPANCPCRICKIYVQNLGFL